MIRVLLVDDDVILTNQIVAFFRNDKKITILATAGNGEEAIKYLSEEINLVLLDYIMPVKDGYGFINYIKEKKLNTRIVLMSKFNIFNMVSLIDYNKINYFFLKPLNMSDLRRVILDVELKIYNDFINIKVTKILNDLGMTNNLNGFKFVRKAIVYVYSSKDDKTIKEVYIVVSNIYKTTRCVVERDMRNAIFISYGKADTDLIYYIFGNSIDKDKSNPTNSEYIFTIADKIRLGMI